MSRFPDFNSLTNPFSLQFEDAVITVSGQVITAINSIKLDQTLTEAAIFGTAKTPLGRTRGRLNLGIGSINFSDFDAACAFYSLLAPDPLFTIFDMQYTLVRPDGVPRMIELEECRVTAISINHSAGGQGAEKTVPFSFKTIKLDGLGNGLGPVQLVQNILGITSAVRGLL